MNNKTTTASTDNILLDLHTSSQDTQPHSLIVKFSTPSIFRSKQLRFKNAMKRGISKIP